MTTTAGPRPAHVWLLDPADVGADRRESWRRLLSPGERHRMHRFLREEERLTYLTAHALVRLALSACVPPVPPAAWTFVASAGGRPELAGPTVTAPGGGRLRFNLSHTGGAVGCVVTVDVPCGIDVERVDRSRDPLPLARAVLTAPEYARVRALPPADRAEMFFRYWTLKEAYVKARGLGLSLPLTALTFDVAADPVRLVRSPDGPARWQFAQWRASERHAAAVALARGPADHPVLVHDVPGELGGDGAQQASSTYSDRCSTSRTRNESGIRLMKPASVNRFRK